MMLSNCHKRQKIENKSIEASSFIDCFERTKKCYSHIDLHLNDETNSTPTRNNNPSSICTTQTIQNLCDFDSYEDIFFNVMHYFVSDSGEVDIDSMNHIMLVSRRWYRLTSSRRLWRNSPKLWHLLGDKNEIPQRHGAVPIFRPIYRESKVPNIKKRLFGFCNLGRIQNHLMELCYKVKERSTGKMYRLNITRLDAGEGEGYRSEKLREIIAMSKIWSATWGLQSGSCEFNHSHLSLLIDWDICDGHLLEWYTYTNSSLRSRLAKEEINTQQIKHILLQILSGIKEFHSCGMILWKLRTENILLNSNGENNFVQMSNFSSSRSLALTTKGDNEGIELSGTIFDAPEILMSRPTYGTPVDMWSIGCIFAEMILSYKKGRPQHSGVVGTRCISNCIPSYYANSLKDRNLPLDDTGLDLLEKLLCSDPKHRITASDAMKHPFFNNQYDGKLISSRCIVAYSNDFVNCFHRLKNLEYRCLHVENSRQHIKPEQWAMLVDWLFEIICVFEKNTRVVFTAMGLLDQYSNQVQTKSKNLQLLAATCLHIASKCDDDSFMTAPDLAYCADNKFDGRAIVNLEKRILGKMYCQQLSFPNIHDFIILYLERLQDTIVRDRQFWLSIYISELALQTSIYLKFLPSTIAASVVVFARHSLGEDIAWPATLERMTGLNLSNLKDCIILLSTFIDLTKVSLPKLKIISRRYNSVFRECVSEIRIKSIRSAHDVIAMNKNIELGSSAAR